MKKGKKDLIRKIALIICSILGVVIVILLPFIINSLYMLEPPAVFFEIGYEDVQLGYSPSELVEYYGVALSFIGTSALTIVIFIINKKSHEKANEVDELKLRLIDKQFEMAKEQFTKSNKGESVPTVNKPVPKFEIRIAGYQGNYANLQLIVKKHLKSDCNGINWREI